MITRLACLSALALAASPSFAVVLATSTFSDGPDDWTAKNGSTDLAWVGSGGATDGGGFVQASDQSGDVLWFFSAPTKFIVQAGKAYGGLLSFQLRVVSPSPPNAGNYASVQLLAADGSSLSYFGNFQPTASWSNYLVPLMPGPKWSFSAPTLQAASPPTAEQMQAVLSDLNAIRILGDYRQKGELTGLDSVVLVASNVPEPAPLALWAAGALALGIRARTARGRQPR